MDEAFWLFLSFKGGVKWSVSKLKKMSNKSQERRDKVLDQPANRAQKSRENAVKIKRYEEPYFRIIQFECCWESPLV